MPKIKEYRTTKEKREASGDERVDAARVEKFRDGLTLYDAWRDEPAFYGWTPGFPCASYGHFGTIPDEALYRSNYEGVKEIFRDELGLELESGSSDTFELPLDMQAVALACRIEDDFDDYPVVDGERMSELEQKLIEEAYKSYGRGDLIKALDTLLAPMLAEELLNEEGDDIAEDYREIAEPYLYRIAEYAVSYSGEMYFGYRSTFRGETTDSWSGLKYALEEVLGIYGGGRALTLEALLDGFVRLLREDKARADRKEFERHQSPLVEVEED